MVSMTNVSFYLLAVYTPTFGDKVLRLSTAHSLLAALAVGVSNAYPLPNLTIGSRRRRAPLGDRLYGRDAVGRLSQRPHLVRPRQKPSRLPRASLWGASPETVK